MKAILKETGIFLDISEYIANFGNEAFISLTRRFTIRTVDKMTKIPQITKLYKMVLDEGVKTIEFPRFALDNLLAHKEPCAKKPITKIKINLPRQDENTNMNYIGQSNPNQLIVVDTIFNEFKKKKVSGFTLNLLAGQGKSFCAMDLIGRMRLKTLIVVPNSYLLDQWVQLIEYYFPDVTVGTLYGKKKKDGDIIIGIINTVCDLQSFKFVEKKPIETIGAKLKYEKVEREVLVDDILKEVGLAIFDESQMYVSKEFRKAFQRIWARYTLGLSATPDIREDKLDIIHQLSLGPILVADELEGFNATQDAFESDACLVEYNAMDEHCKFNIREDGMIDYSSVISAIVSDPYRNDLIVNEIVQLMKQDHYTFVFSDRRMHLEHLYSLLEQKCSELNMISCLEMPESDKKIILYGGSSEETIDKAKKQSTVIFTTYAYSSTGVSITKMDALVLTTPRRSNMKQIINRVFRLGSDQTIRRTIIDIVDTKLPIKQQIRERVKAYRERSCDIKKRKVYAKNMTLKTYMIDIEV